MPELQDTRKSVFVHLGPHKTGTTAIQHYFRKIELANQDSCFLHNSETHRAALALAQGKYEDAESRLKEVSASIQKEAASRVLLSHEDFCGTLLGRGSGKRPYRHLTKNMRILARSLKPHSVTFIFFKRDPSKWMRSCYSQNVRFRDKFYSYDDFLENFTTPDWDELLAKPIETFGEYLKVFDYNSHPAHGVSTIYEAMGLRADEMEISKVLAPVRNQSLAQEELRICEFINKRAFVRSLITTYKDRAIKYLRDERPALNVGADTDSSYWPPSFSKPKSDFSGLEALSERAHKRVGEQQEQPDLLPDTPMDVVALSLETMPKEVELPDVPRGRMEDQYRILEHHLRGASRLAFINALAISYLRRHTEHTAKAKAVFHDIWKNGGLYLSTELSTRWILSTLQTFLDHPENSQQKVIGAAGYFYGNMLKISEGERALEGLEPNNTYPNVEPITKNGFRGLDRFKVGGTDLLLNTNALALEISALDPVAGLVLEEFLLRAKNSKTVFQRFDATRKEKSIDQYPFNNVWSFFDEPSLDE